MTIDPVTATVAAILVPILLGVVGWFGKRQVERLEQGLEAERAARDNDRHQLRTEINGVGLALQKFELTVAKECINRIALTEALAPLMQRITEVRGDIKELYERTTPSSGPSRGSRGHGD